MNGLLKTAIQFEQLNFSFVRIVVVKPSSYLVLATKVRYAGCSRIILPPDRVTAVGRE